MQGGKAPGSLLPRVACPASPCAGTAVPKGHARAETSPVQLMTPRSTSALRCPLIVPPAFCVQTYAEDTNPKINLCCDQNGNPFGYNSLASGSAVPTQTAPPLAVRPLAPGLRTATGPGPARQPAAK